LVLAARFRKPWPIVLGILVATLVNHALAGAVGAWITTMLGPDACAGSWACHSSPWRVDADSRQAGR
jgi:putative Ca2+/H+ antiporter (TMEM165/GDT1 family)